MDLSFLCIFLHYSFEIKPLVNCSGKKNSTKTSEFAVPSEGTNPVMKSCYVLLEDILCHYDAEKLKTLVPCPENIHMTSSSQIMKGTILRRLAWNNQQLCDDWKMSTGFSLIQQTSHWEHYNWGLNFIEIIYDEGINKHSIEQVIQKSTLWAKISLGIDPLEQASLQNGLHQIKEKTWLCCRQEAL